MMSFESFGGFLVMDHHGPYVWSTYDINLLVLVINVAGPLPARHRYLQKKACRLCWEVQQ